MRRLAWLCAAVLFPVAAQASFGGGKPCPDFQCYFAIFGVLLGAVGGIPVSSAIFLCLHMFFCHPERSQRRQVFLGAVIGFIAFEVVAVAASFALLWEQAHPGQSKAVTLAGPVALYLLMAVGSVLSQRGRGDQAVGGVAAGEIVLVAHRAVFGVGDRGRGDTLARRLRPHMGLQAYFGSGVAGIRRLRFLKYFCSTSQIRTANVQINKN